MIEAIQSLLRLQEVDLQLHAAGEELAAIGPRRVAAAAERARERLGVEEAEKALAEIEHRNRELEGELRDVEAVLEKLNAQVYEVTSKQALEALQKELSRAEGQKSDREDLILELLESIDSATGVLEAVRTTEREGKEAGAGEEVELCKREQECAADIERLEPIRSELASGVEAGVIRAYDRARRKRLPAVVFTEEKSCPICRMKLGAQMLIELRAADVLVHCGTCDRILFGEKVAEAERANAESG